MHTSKPFSAARTCSESCPSRVLEEDSRQHEFARWPSAQGLRQRSRAGDDVFFEASCEELSAALNSELRIDIFYVAVDGVKAQSELVSDVLLGSTR